MYEPSIQSIRNALIVLVYDLKKQYPAYGIVILFSFLSSLYLCASVVEPSSGPA